MSVHRIRVVIAPSTLVRAQDGLDLDATGARFVGELEAALRAELPELHQGTATLELTHDRTRTAHLVEVTPPGSDEPVARRIERDVRDLIWVVRECASYAVQAK